MACCVVVYTSCAGANPGSQGSRDARVTTEALALVDRTRNRPVPVVIYTDAERPERARRKLAVISHGYGGKNTDYSFVAAYLASRGYCVLSVQHEIPGDEPLPRTGKAYEARMPSWKRGVENITFVIAETKKTRPDLDYAELVLIGHSHGGDTSMLFAREHPDLVSAVVSLDSRRMPFPRAKRPRVLSLRSSDQLPDDGVLPPTNEQAALGMTVVELPATLHNEMCDAGTTAQKTEMLRYIDEFLGGERPR